MNRADIYTAIDAERIRQAVKWTRPHPHHDRAISCPIYDGGRKQAAHIPITNYQIKFTFKRLPHGLPITEGLIHIR